MLYPLLLLRAVPACSEIEVAAAQDETDDCRNLQFAMEPKDSYIPRRVLHLLGRVLAEAAGGGAAVRLQALLPPRVHRKLVQVSHCLSLL